MADDHALAHVEEQTMLQHAEHAGQLGVNVLNVKACAEVQIRDKVAVIGNEGLAVAYTQNRIPAVSCHALHRLLGAVLFVFFF